MNRDARIFVAGETTLIGAAILRALEREGFRQFVGRGASGPELTNAESVASFFAKNLPEYVIVAAGRSGGIDANQKYPADLMLDNLLVATAVIPAAYRHGVRKLLYLASSCCYPKHCAQPMSVTSLNTGPLEPTSEPYAMAKLAGIRLCQSYWQQHHAPFITAIPADVFGPGSKFDAVDSHVIPALIVKMHQARQANSPSVTLWGTGSPLREFLFVDDLANACLLLLRCYDEGLTINLGGGHELSIREAAETIREVVGYNGELKFDTSRPDGMPRKLLDSAPLQRLGWQRQTDFRTALEITYRSYLDS